MASEQGMVTTAAKTPDLIKTPEEYRNAIRRWTAADYNLLTPFASISGLAADYYIQATMVQLSPNKEDGDCYDGLPFLEKNEVAPAKIGLRKIAECGGISTSTTRTDPRTIRHYWEYKAIASYRGADGAVITREASMEWDLRDGSQRLKGWTHNQIEEGRKNGLRNCETRAINAAIREFGIKQKYTRAELEKPFVVLRVVFQPDMNDPDIKRMVTSQALGGTHMLYPPQPRESASSPVEDDDPPVSREQPRQVGSGSTATAVVKDAATTAEKDAEPAKSDAPPVDGAVRIVAVSDWATGETNGKKWKRCEIKTSAGTSCTTFSETDRNDAIRFRDEKTWLEVTVETTQKGDKEYRNLVEMAVADQQPSLLPDPKDL